MELSAPQPSKRTGSIRRNRQVPNFRQALEDQPNILLSSCEFIVERRSRWADEDGYGCGPRSSVRHHILRRHLLGTHQRHPAADKLGECGRKIDLSFGENRSLGGRELSASRRTVGGEQQKGWSDPTHKREAAHDQAALSPFFSA